MTADPSPSPPPRREGAAYAVQRLLDLVDRTAVGRLWQRLVEVEFVDRSIALAAKAFVSLFPLLAVAAAVSPPAVGQGIITSLASRFGLEGRSLDLVRESFATTDQIRASTSVIGVVLTVLFAVSFTTALQRCYLRVWRRPPGGSLRDRQRGFVWLACATAFLATVGAVSRVLVGPPGTVVTAVLGLGGSTLLWWWTAHTLLRGAVRWRPLLPTALATGIGASAYAVAASVWMPRVIADNVGQFGFLGRLAVVRHVVRRVRLPPARGRGPRPRPLRGRRPARTLARPRRGAHVRRAGGAARPGHAGTGARPAAPQQRRVRAHRPVSCRAEWNEGSPTSIEGRLGTLHVTSGGHGERHPRATYGGVHAPRSS